MNEADTGHALQMLQYYKRPSPVERRVQTLPLQATERVTRSALPLDEDGGEDAGRDVVISVYPLRANEARLNAFCENYLTSRGLPDESAFQVWGTHVYLIVTSYRSGRLFEPREVAFSIPVQWTRNGSLLNRFLVSPYVFVESDDDTIIDREWNGRPTVDAEITTNGQDWRQRNSSLTLKTDVLPEGPRPGPIAQKTLLRIENGGPKRPGNGGGDSAASVAPSYAWTSAAPPSEKALETAKVLALEMLVSGSQRVSTVVKEILQKKKPAKGEADQENPPRPVKDLTIREFRDAEHLDVSCYQEVLLARRVITKFYHETEEFDETTRVIIGRYGRSYNIVEEFDLQKESDGPSLSGDGVQAEVFIPDRPFQIAVRMDEPTRSDIYWSGDNHQWNRNPLYESPGGPPTYNPNPILGTAILEALRQPLRNLTDSVARWLQENSSSITKNTLDLTLVDGVSDPLVVIASILDDERWGQKSSDFTAEAV